MSKNRRRGKDLERFVAFDLPGGRRVGILGQEDVSLPGFSIECKERKKYPAFLDNAMSQAVKNCRGKMPIVIFHKLNQIHENDLVIMRYSDWRKFIKKEEGK